jgi:hypothetical protein
MTKRKFVVSAHCRATVDNESELYHLNWEYRVEGVLVSDTSYSITVMSAQMSETPEQAYLRRSLPPNYVGKRVIYIPIHLAGMDLVDWEGMSTEEAVREAERYTMDTCVVCSDPRVDVIQKVFVVDLEKKETYYEYIGG